MPTKTTLPQMPPPSPLKPLRPAEDFGLLDPASTAPDVPDAWAQSNARLAREQGTSASGYAGAMWRQDGLTDGALAWAASLHIPADPNFNPLADTSMKVLENGINPELVPELYKATSKGHAYFLRDRLLQKQDDQAKLGDLGAAGTTGRFAFGVLMPENLAVGLASGGAAYGAGIYRTSRALKLVKDAGGLAKMEALAGLQASQAAAGAGARGVAAAVGLGAAENAGLEKLRQNLNYERDSEAVLMSALMGAGITLPFAIRGSRAATRASRVAMQEAEAIRTLRKLEEGQEVTPTEAASLRQVHDANRILHDLESGKLSPEDAGRSLDELHGPHEPDEQWVHRLGERLREDADGWMDEHLQGPTKAPEGPYAAPLESAEATPAVAPAVASEAAAVPGAPAVDLHAQWAGKEVTWADKEGNTLEGTVTSYNPEIGKVIVKTADGHKAVFPEHLDQHTGPAPEGFGGGQSVGSAQVHGTQIDSAATQETALRKYRFDYFALLNASPLKTVRGLASKLVKDALQTDKFDAQSMSASEVKDMTRRIHAGAFHVEREEAFMGAVKDMKVSLWQRSGFAQDFHEWVTKATHDPAFASTLPPELQPHIQKASSAMQTFFRRILKEAQDAGVKGAENVKADDLYTNRIWHQGQIRDLARVHGDEALYTLLSSAFKDKAGMLERLRESTPGAKEVRDTLTNKVTHPGISDAELLRRKAKRFLQAVKALEFSPAVRDVALAGRDMGTLRRELRAMGVEDNHIDELVDLLFEVRPGADDAGRMANLKYRLQLDPSAEVTTPTGKLRMSDLWENDSRVLVDHYASGMAGRIGLAKHGITSDADWSRHLQAIADEGKVNLGYDASRISADVQRLQDVYSHIIGRPMSDQAFSLTNRSAGVLRSYTRSVMLPQLGISSFFEMGKAVAMFGFSNMLRQMPSLRGFLRALRQGHLPDDGLAQQVRLMSGFGNEMASRYARGQEIADGFFGQTMSRAENWGNRLSHVTDTISGNASITSMSKQWAAMGSVQEFSNVAHGRKLTEKRMQRWVGQGISQDDLPDVMAAFKEHTTRDAKGTVLSIDYETWHKADAKTYESFQTFLSRQVREAIQDHDIGESAPFMHGPIGKIFGELKTFFLVGHAKNMLKQVYHWDNTTAQVFTIGFIAEALAYSTQAAINTPGELNKKLQPEEIARAAFFRMASLGTLSTLAETGYQVASGGDSLIKPGTTANTDNRSFLNTPSLILAKRLGNSFATLGGMVLGTDTTTRKEAQDLIGTVPVLGRMYGVNGLLQAWAADHPANDPSKVRTP